MTLKNFSVFIEFLFRPVKSSTQCFMTKKISTMYKDISVKATEYPVRQKTSKKLAISVGIKGSSKKEGTTH